MEPIFWKIVFSSFIGVSTIRTFHSAKDAVSWEYADMLMDTLASLPSLKKLTLGSFSGEAPHAGGPDGEFPELTNLLESSSLRSVEFSEFNFTSGISRALLAAFEEGTSVINLLFTNCSLVWEDYDNSQAATLLQALQNFSVKPSHLLEMISAGYL
jgi:hypothetical protein